MKITPIILTLLAGLILIIGINLFFSDTIQGITYINWTSILLQNAIFIVVYSFYWDAQFQIQRQNEELLKKSNEEQVIISSFNNNKKIFLRVPQGFVTIPVVIQKDLGWEFSEGRYTNNELFYTISELQEFQATY